MTVVLRLLALLVGLDARAPAVGRRNWSTHRRADASPRPGSPTLDVLRASRLLDVQRHVVDGAVTGLDLVVIYATVGFVLRQFPYTRPWGESMRGFLLTTVEDLGLGDRARHPRAVHRR